MVCAADIAGSEEARRAACEALSLLIKRECDAEVLSAPFVSRSGQVCTEHVFYRAGSCN